MPKSTAVRLPGSMKMLRWKSDNSLDRYIDGITGATMSVSAVNRQVKLALLLDQVVREKSDDN